MSIVHTLVVTGFFCSLILVVPLALHIFLCLVPQLPFVFTKKSQESSFDIFQIFTFSLFCFPGKVPSSSKNGGQLVFSYKILLKIWNDMRSELLDSSPKRVPTGCCIKQHIMVLIPNLLVLLQVNNPSWYVSSLIVRRFEWGGKKDPRLTETR